MAYLEQHPPDRLQFYKTRRRTPTGCYVIHTSEFTWTYPVVSLARFIAERDVAGSYLDAVGGGSQPEVIEIGRPEWTMFHAGGHNSYTLSLAFNCRSIEWPTIPLVALRRWLELGAIQAAVRAKWLHTETGITIPAERITRADAIDGRPGFIGHGDIDGPNNRRTDPGRHFPWKLFLELYAAATNQQPGEPTVSNQHVIEWQQLLIDGGQDLGPTGADGDFGPRTLAASVETARIARTASIALDDAALGARYRETIDLYHSLNDAALGARYREVLELYQQQKNID